MAAMIYRATELGKIDRSKSQWLWRTLSAKGWRLKEPAAIDIPQERPTLISAMFGHLVDDEGLSTDEIGRLLHLSYNEIDALYGLGFKRNNLRLVK